MCALDCLRDDWPDDLAAKPVSEEAGFLDAPVRIYIAHLLRSSGTITVRVLRLLGVHYFRTRSKASLRVS